MCLLFSLLPPPTHLTYHPLSPRQLVLLNCPPISILHILVRVIFKKFKLDHATNLKASNVCSLGLRITLETRATEPRDWDTACLAS